jgi:AraC-like DNA-binding protein
MIELAYCERPPSPMLAPFVRCLWMLRGPAGTVPAQPVVPDGCVELVLHRGDPFRQVTDALGTAVPQPRALLVGATTTPVVIAPTGVVDVIGVRLHPWSGEAFLGVPIDALRGALVPLDAALPALAAELDRALAGAPAAEALARLTSCLERQAAARPRPDPAVREVVLRVSDARVLPSVRQMASSLGRSTRWVQRAFAAGVGIGPKTLSRIARVQRALRLATRGHPTSWSAIAADAGYFDHSHLVRDFRRFVGRTPSEFDPQLMPITDVFVER